MKTFEKFKAWLLSAGLRSIGWVGGCFAAALLFGSDLLLGAGIGVLVSDNWVTIKELIKK